MKRKKTVKDMIVTFVTMVQETGMVPAASAVARELGYRSHRSMYPLLRYAEEMGYIEYERRGRGIPIIITVTEKGFKFYERSLNREMTASAQKEDESNSGKEQFDVLRTE